MKFAYSLSIIIPIRISLNNRFLYKRLHNLVNYFSKNKNIEIVIVDSSINFYSSKIAKYENINYLYVESDSPYSASKSRNYGVKYANGEYVLFYDVDLVVKDDFILKILENIRKLKLVSKKEFEIYPCLYLTEEKTKEIDNESYLNHLKKMAMKLQI